MLSVRLDAVRASWQQGDSAPCFFDWPKRLHGEYQAHREASPLGRVFKIANSMQDEIDAVVVVGSAAALSGIRVLVDTCCEPLHNELTRAERGSRPRIYFVGATVDNDAISAVIDRLNASQSGESQVGMPVEPVPRRWALVVLSDSGQVDDRGTQTAVVLSYLLDALRINLGAEADRSLPRYFIPFAHQGSWLHRLATEIGCDEIFEVSPGVFPDVAEPFGTLGLALHLPAAMLGLDCMRLLGGAHAMTEHFWNAAYGENAILQYVAVNQSLAAADSEQCESIAHRAVSIWNDALMSWGEWYEHLLLGAGGRRDKVLSATTRSAFHDRSACGIACQAVVDHHVMSLGSRTDPLKRTDTKASGGQASEILEDLTTSGHDLASVREAAISARQKWLRTQGCPTTTIVLPDIDSFVIGQAFQMMMIATRIEHELGR